MDFEPEIIDQPVPETIDVSDLELNPEILFEGFIQKYKKSYPSKAERARRFLIFKNNLLKIREYNSDPNDSGSYSINHLADVMIEEITGIVQPKWYEMPMKTFKSAGNLSDIPAKFDWREHGAVTSVKQQGSCGSCWTFSVAGVVEGAYFRKHNRLFDFSEQQILDCDSTNTGM